MKSVLKLFLISLLLITVTVWFAVIFFPRTKFEIITCDVGQGDATLVQYKNIQILTDGGPDNKIISCLSRYMPFWDREIEAVILTHPQTDHYTGLINVFERYKVDYFIANALESSSQSYQVLKNSVGSNGSSVINPTSGRKMRFGLIYLDILWPSGQFISENMTPIAGKEKSNVLGAYTTKVDPNKYSINFILSYADFSALMTGDISPEEIDQIISYGKVRDVDYLKVPHHGSKNGMTKEVLEHSRPEVAVISVARNNSYGHPHKEVINMLREKGINIYRTDEVGDIRIVIDKKTGKN